MRFISRLQEVRDTRRPDGPTLYRVSDEHGLVLTRLDQ